MAEHVLVEHPEVESQALVPSDALEHYAQRGWKRVEGVEPVNGDTSIEQVQAQAGIEVETPAESVPADEEGADLSKLTREVLLERARSQGLDVDAKTTKADLLGLLSS